jgi:beta-glucosidase
MTKLVFPKGFEWGAATASYQIEGAYNEDGKGESIWDRFSHIFGNTLNGDTGNIACDHYHRYQDDIALMKEMGIDTYRFSIAWPRILPTGKNKINKKGLDFYKRLVEELHQAGIKPTATLYHWDLPQGLQDNGGWKNRDTVNYFNQYAQIMFAELGDLIPRWITHNEPFVAAFVGNLFGEHAPGYKDYNKAVQVSHNLLLSHGMAVQSYREADLDGEVGITLDLAPIYSNSDSKKDKMAKDYCDAFNNRWFLDPIFKGRYPKVLLDLYKNKFPGFYYYDQDLKTISQEIDFLGINYYSRTLVKYSNDNILKHSIIKPDSSEYTEMGWEVYPQGLYDLLIRLKNEYTKEKPLYITENGAAFKDDLSDDGAVHDEKRKVFLKEHLKKAHQAIEDNVPLQGYYVWSLMDNFEWAYGYSKRFGLIFVDFKDKQKRIFKDSAKWYQKVISENRL